MLSGAPGAESPHEAFFYYVRNELHAVRSGRWKLHVPHGYGTIEGAELRTSTFQGTYAQAEIGLSLFDLEADVGETTNVADEQPEVVERLMELIKQARDDLGDSLTDREGRNVRPPGRVESSTQG